MDQEMVLEMVMEMPILVLVMPQSIMILVNHILPLMLMTMLHSIYSASLQATEEDDFVKNYLYFYQSFNLCS